MRLLEVNIKLAKKYEAEQLPEDSVNWEDSKAFIDLDLISAIYDSKDDGVKVVGRDMDIFVDNYTLIEIVEFWVGLKELPKLKLSKLCNPDGSKDLYYRLTPGYIPPPEEESMLPKCKWI